MLAAAGRAGEVALVEGLADQGFDDGLAADVEFFGGVFQFFEHGGGEIDVHALDGLPHLSGVGEKARNVLAAVGHARDGVGGEWFFSRMRFFHRVSGLREWPSRESRDDRTPLGVLADFKNDRVQAIRLPNR